MKKILVASGKGGVGKTTISVSIAKILSKVGYKVGLLDIDIDTPNIPEFIGINDRNVELSDIGLIPKDFDGIEVMSVGLLADTDTAIMWNGNKRAMAIDQMIRKVDWKCDVLVIDSPPGTTDEIITVIKKFSPDGIIIVTTNHKASISDVKRTLVMIRLLGSKNVIGIVKNMTCIRCSECGNKMNIFNNSKDKSIDELVIAEVPYTDNEDEIHKSLKGAVDKIEGVL